MRKQISPDTTCGECGSVLSHGDYEWVCDVCNQKLPDLGGEIPSITVHFNRRLRVTTDAVTINVCSWKCVAKWLKDPTCFPAVNRANVWFISLPFILSSFGKSISDSIAELLNAFSTNI